MIRSMSIAVFCVGLFFLDTNQGLAQNTAAVDAISSPWNSPEKYRDRILVEHDPFAALSYIGAINKKDDVPIFDPDLRHKVFMHAMELKDLFDLVHVFNDARTLRLALEERDQCSFCQKPAEFLAWTDRYFHYFGPIQRLSLRHAVLEWDTLGKEYKDWLIANGESEKSWSSLDLPQRSAKLRTRANKEFERLMKETPANGEALEDFYNKGDYFFDFLSSERKGLLSDRARALRASINGLIEAQKRLDSGTNLELHKMLEQAKSAPDVESKLSLLKNVFDGLGVNNEAVSAEAPAREGQKFTEKDRSILASMLSTNLLHIIGGTWAGEDLNAFYATNRLDLHIAPDSEATTIASANHRNNALTFNEAYLQQYIKGNGRDIADLWNGKAPELYQELTIMLAGDFVHEATHHIQFIWAKSQDLPFIGGQHVESEAMQAETLFILEKSKRDPKYAALLKKDASWSMLARESISLAQRMQTNTLADFRATVNAWNYPKDFSLESAAREYSSGQASDIRDIQDELNRRKQLSRSQQRKLEKAPPMPGGIHENTAWHRALREAGTGDLRSILNYKTHRLDDVPRIYKAYSEHLRETNQHIEKRLNALLSDKNNAPEKKIDALSPSALLKEK